MGQRILVVCKGNICRSPIATEILRARGDGELEIRSRGTEAYHIGKIAHPDASNAARERGYDISNHRAAQLDIADVQWADVVLVMDEENFKRLGELLPVPVWERKVIFLGEFLTPPSRNIVDPYKQPFDEFRKCVTQVEKACLAFLQHVQALAV